MIYKCKKCKYTTEDLSRQVCPLCGNKIVQKTEESTDGFCNVYGVKINLKTNCKLFYNSTNKMILGLIMTILSNIKLKMSVRRQRKKIDGL